MFEDVDKREHLCTVGGNVNQCSHYGKSMKFPQRIKNRTTIWFSNSTPGYISKGEKKVLKRYFTPMFNVVLSTITKYGYNLSVHQDSWENKMWCAYAMKYS